MNLIRPHFIAMSSSNARDMQISECKTFYCLVVQFPVQHKGQGFRVKFFAWNCAMRYFPGS